jgi:cardiolipin synthase (CMP-forming)
MPRPLFTVANQLTLLRMALAPFLVLALTWGWFGWAVAVFAVAGLTDLLDGFIARYGHQKTALGATLDPVADKILLGVTFVALTWNSAVQVRIPVWVTVVTLSRDLMIMVAVVIVNLVVERRIFFPSVLGKATTVLQLITAATVIFLNWARAEWTLLPHLFLLTVLVTVGSGAHYIYLASTHKGKPVRE